MKNLFLIGGGGHCKSCIDVIEQSNEFTIKGIFDLKEKVGEKILGYTIIDSDENIKDYIDNSNFFLITLGQIKTPELRIKKIKELELLNANLAVVVSPRAYLSKHAEVGDGTIILHDAFVNAGAKVGKNCIINTKSLIEHDSIVEDCCHISTGTVLNGEAHVKKNSFIGSNTVLRERCTIEENSVIAFGTKL